MSLAEAVGRRLGNPRQAERSRQLRRAFPVQVYVGRNGSGKSLAAVYDTLPDLDAGLPVLSTVRLLDWRNPRPCDDESCSDQGHGSPGHMAAHPSYTALTKWEQLIGFKHGAVLMDEITGIADSNSASLPAVIENLFAQMRRGDFMVRITAINFIRAHKRLREVTNAVTRCTSFMPVTVQNDDGTDRLWRQRRLAVWRTYDAQSLPIDDHTEAAYESADLLVKGRFWIPGSEPAGAYDTYSPVHTVGSVTEAGLCHLCDGTRRRHECTCSDYQAEKQARKAVRPQARSGEDGGPAQLGPLRSVNGSSRSRR